MTLLAQVIGSVEQLGAFSDMLEIVSSDTKDGLAETGPLPGTAGNYADPCSVRACPDLGFSDSLPAADRRLVAIAVPQV